MPAHRSPRGKLTWLALLACLGANHAAAEPDPRGPLLLDDVTPPSPPTLVTTREKAIEKYDDGTVRFEREVAKYSDNSFVNNGAYREYYPSGELFVQGAFKLGVRTGEWSFFHPNGELAKEVTYVDGKPDGVVEVRRQDGTLQARRHFSGGERVGKWLDYDSTGQKPIRERHYVGGKPAGVWKQWFANGQLLRETPFEDGLRQGRAREWNEDGTPRATAEFKAGKRDGLSVLWNDDGERVERYYKDGKPQSR